MNFPPRRALIVTALLVTVGTLSGCFGALEDPGPLTVQLKAVEVHAPGNLTLHLMYENTGGSPLSRIETWWQATVRNVNGTAHGWARSTITGDYGEWELIGRPFGVFNETEELPGGMMKHANITVRYSMNDSRLAVGEVYSVIAHADYRSDTHLYRWRHVMPCIDADESLVYDVACDSWTATEPLPIRE